MTCRAKIRKLSRWARSVFRKVPRARISLWIYSISWRDPIVALPFSRNIVPGAVSRAVSKIERGEGRFHILDWINTDMDTDTWIVLFALTLTVEEESLASSFLRGARRLWGSSSTGRNYSRSSTRTRSSSGSGNGGCTYQPVGVHFNTPGGMC